MLMNSILSHMNLDALLEGVREAILHMPIPLWRLDWCMQDTEPFLLWRRRIKFLDNEINQGKTTTSG